jgi:uncharacterized protein (TIGR03437 family)
MRLCFFLGLGVQSALLALTPHVTQVWNAATDGHFSPELPVQVIADGLGDHVTVQVGGLSAPVLDRQPRYDDNDVLVGDILSIQFPTELKPGTVKLVVTSGSASSDPYNLTIDSFSPGLDPRTVERALPNGGFAPYTCSAGETPKPGELVRAYVVGLGATDPWIATGTTGPAAPLARTLEKPSVAVGNYLADVVESVLAPGEIGVYRITFRIPAAIGIGGHVSTGSDLRIGQTVVPGPPGLNQVAPESISSIYACGGSFTSSVPAGASQIVAHGDGLNPPTSLAGTTVRVKDSQGIEQFAPLLYVSPIQINYIVPRGAALGNASITITTGDGSVSVGTLDVLSIAPQLFFQQPGLTPAALVVRVRNGLQTVEPIVQTESNGAITLATIDLGPETDQVFLVLYGTGLRYIKSLNAVMLNIGSVDSPVLYAGAQTQFAGWIK